MIAILLLIVIARSFIEPAGIREAGERDDREPFGRESIRVASDRGTVYVHPDLSGPVSYRVLPYRKVTGWMVRDELD